MSQYGFDFVLGMGDPEDFVFDPTTNYGRERKLKIGNAWTFQESYDGADCSSDFKSFSLMKGGCRVLDANTSSIETCRDGLITAHSMVPTAIHLLKPLVCLSVIPSAVPVLTAKEKRNH